MKKDKVQTGFDYKWLIGTVFFGLVGIIFTYYQFHISQMEYELKIDPILNAEFKINVFEGDTELILTNNGVTPINDICVDRLPRIFGGPNYKILGSTSSKSPWKTIKKLDSSHTEKLILDEEFLRNGVRNQILFYEEYFKKSYLFPVLLVYISYRRPADNKLFIKQKYLYVAEGVVQKEEHKEHKIIPIDLDATQHQWLIDLREKIREFDNKVIESRS